MKKFRDKFESLPKERQEEINKKVEKELKKLKDEGYYNFEVLDNDLRKSR